MWEADHTVREEEPRSNKLGEGEGRNRRLLKARPCSGGRYYSDSLSSVPKKPLEFPTNAVTTLVAANWKICFLFGLSGSYLLPNDGTQRQERYVESGGYPNIKTSHLKNNGELKNTALCYR